MIEAGAYMSSVVSALPGGFASRQRDYPNGEKLIFSFSGLSGVIGWL